MKSEPAVYSIEDLRRDRVAGWDGVRNYEARNHMKAMARGDGVLFYHSNASPSGVAGIAKVVRTAYPDPVQFDTLSKYFDPKAAQDAPRWFQVDVRFVKAFKATLPLDEIRRRPPLKGMSLLKRKRLSVTSVTQAEWDHILKASA